MKYLTTEVVMREFPGEIALAINLTRCPNNCIGCHSPILRQDIGTELTIEELDNIIKLNEGITCIGFMGGDNQFDEMIPLINFIRTTYPMLKIGWYSGRDYIIYESIEYFDYVKIGSYQEKYGALDSPQTNQIMFMKKDNKLINITKKFLIKK